MCFSLPDYDEVWSYSEDLNIEECVIPEDRAIIRTETTLSCISTATGTQMWSTGDLIFHLSTDGTNIYDINYNIFKALDPSGAVIWTYDFGFQLNWSIQSKLVNENLRYLNSADGTISFNILTMEPIWQSPHRGTFYILEDKLIIENSQIITSGEQYWTEN